MTFSSDQITALDDLALLHFTGADTVSFLQSQLTNAVDQINPDQAVLAGFCQAKGRLQATLVVWADPQDATARYALVKQSIAANLQKRLSLFVLRAKVKIEISAARVYGVTAAPTGAFTLPTEFYPVHHQGPVTLVGAPTANLNQPARAWLVQTDPAATPLEAQAQPSDWQAADIGAGLAWVDEHNYESFLPQDLNLDIVGGVSFKKGCFPGQEVVARLHYRTTARRRAALGYLTGTPLALQPGQDVFSTDAPERALGRIINSAYDQSQQHTALLMEVLIEGLEQKELFVLDEQAAPHTIRLAPLPYSWEIAKY